MNLCKKIGKSIAIAFSMYSKILWYSLVEGRRYALFNVFLSSCWNCNRTVIMVLVALSAIWRGKMCLHLLWRSFFVDRRYSCSWLYGYDGCASFLLWKREKLKS